MKALPALPFIAALAAFVPFPPSFEMALATLAAAGITALMIADYSNRRHFPAVRRAIAPVAAALPRERLGLAA